MSLIASQRKATAQRESLPARIGDLSNAREGRVLAREYAATTLTTFDLDQHFPFSEDKYLLVQLAYG